MKDYFEKADTKKDNSLSVKELEKFLSKMNISIPKDEFKTLMKVNFKSFVIEKISFLKILGY